MGTGHRKGNGGRGRRRGILNGHLGKVLRTITLY